MLTYTLKRLLATLPVLFVVSVAIFLIIHITPGSPAATILGMEATSAQIEAFNEEMGYNRPLIEQYTSWVSGIVQGDFGDSLFMNQTVLGAVSQHIGPTLSLALLSQLIAIVLAIPLGILAAHKRGTILDTMLMSFSLFGMAVPNFLLALILMLILGVNLGWLPVAGYAPLSSGLINHLTTLLLPALSLGAIQAALITRMTRSAMLDVLSLHYMRAARSKGLKERTLLIKHAFRNAFLPILTVIGQTFGTLVTGAVVIETIFNIPGLGQLIINSIVRRDYVVIQGVVLIVTLIYLFINLVIDLLYGVVDPRVRLDRKE
ncbi:peptide/nickel transport system permease protein [Amphibacillus marinus]|uniref:Peptide/nickel transport system permease protein n=1 Tax=Amphibacillus marinus TaxID=872970 RepID=A0A1H8M2Q3_9BACI|nr:ABC transporter permease [Amphibacillus marinus]SEO11684.1 peptide/nickel transport system permease protein [Amphibacillus marinus]